MGEEYRATLLDVIRNLRQIVLESSERNDKQDLVELAATFDFLVKAVYLSKDQKVASILERMESFARYTLMGVAWKVDLPSVEEIDAAFSPELDMTS